MTTPVLLKRLNVLLIEDNPGDVRLIREALSNDKAHNGLHVVQDGVEAEAFLRRDGKYADVPRPDLILLDLDLPKKDGRKVLADTKTDEQLRHIPVMVLTTSQADEDILKAYDLNANCYVTKPVELEDFMRVVKSIGDFWLTIAKLAFEPLIAIIHPYVYLRNFLPRIHT